MTTPPTITRDEMFAPLLAADPSFLPHWQAFLEDWGDDAEPPLYLALGELSRHLAYQLRAGDVANFEAVFAVVERWHTHGDAWVREAATIGLLEGLQGTLDLLESCRRGDDPPVPLVTPWLGPETQRWWDRLIRFWDGDPRALQDS